MSSLEVNFNHGIEIMQTRFSTLQKKYSQYLDLSLKIQTSPEKYVRNGKTITIFLGDSYFVDLTTQESLDFLERRIASVEDDMRIALEKLAAARRAVKDMEKLSRETKGLKLESDNESLASKPKSILKKVESSGPAKGPEGHIEQGRDVIKPEETTKISQPTYQLDESEFYTEDGLPMMDIREELDEDGNVVSSTVEPQNKNHELRAFAQDHLSRIIQQREDELNKKNDEGKDRITEVSSTIKPVVYGPERPPKAVSGGIIKKNSTVKFTGKEVTSSSKKAIGKAAGSTNSAATESHEPDRKPRTSGIESITEPSTSVVEHVEGSTSSVSPGVEPVATVTSEPTPPEHLLELELIANELDDEEDFSGDDGEYDYEEEEEEEDEDEYGRTRGSLFPFAKNISSNSGEAGDKKKVNFSENLEIKTYEIGGKIEEKDEGEDEEEEEEVDEGSRRKTSRFKAELLHNSERKGKKKISDVVERPVSDIIERPVSDVIERPVSDVIERPVSDVIERPVSDVIERPVSNVSVRPMSDVVERPTSVVKSSPISSSRKPPTTASTPTSSRRIFQKQQIPTNKKPATKVVPMDPRAGLNLPEETVYEESVASGLATAPSNRPFTDDIYELAAENFENSLISNNAFLELHDQDGFEESDDSEGEEKEDRPILSTSVYERDDDENEIDNDIDDDEDYDQAISKREIAEEYQRLRQKLIGTSGGFKKTDDEQIFEPLNEDGTDVKVSRFKSARLANRYLPSE